jgi:acyl carrier protein
MITVNDIIEILQEQNDHIQLVDVDPEKSLLHQGLDSLDMMDLYFNLEEKYGVSIEFSDESSQDSQWASLNQIVAGINEFLREKNA